MVIKFVQSCARTRVSIGLHKVPLEVEFRSIFCATFGKFKILVIPNVLAHRKSYEHGFVKKYVGHKVCAKLHVNSSFNRFFLHHLRNSKYWQFPTY
ncbi:hypothetical protein B296_00044694 [Ensete ventricosum]|uniref:Uncharacterized protein n=1 Tax=Ensete ventricosum TaxID=4639 RepID=A0A426XJQ7_ENSVE|nr:hypothetical protein B296_00044694 [Ensete ventricosum]